MLTTNRTCLCTIFSSNVRVRSCAIAMMLAFVVCYAFCVAIRRFPVVHTVITLSHVLG
jgi:hypothetical protein